MAEWGPIMAKRTTTRASRAPSPVAPKSQIRVSAKASRWRKLRFKMQDQRHANWCWAAVAASVADYYGRGAKFTQCVIANVELDREDCCRPTGGLSIVPFDVPHVLGAPLYRIGCAPNLGAERQAQLKEIRREIDGQRPVCARVIWTKGNTSRVAAGAHFITIFGYLPGTDRLAIEDPWLAPSYQEISYKDLCNDYDGRGIWTHTYFTRPPRP